MELSEDPTANSINIPSMTVEQCEQQIVKETLSTCLPEQILAASIAKAVADDVSADADSLSDTLRIVHFGVQETEAASSPDHQCVGQPAELGQSLTNFRGDNESFSSFSSTGTDLSMNSAAAATNNAAVSSHAALTSSGISSNCNSQCSSKTATLQYSSSHFSYSPPASTKSLHPSICLNVASLKQQAPVAEQVKSQSAVPETEQNKQAPVSSQSNAVSGGSFFRQVLSWATKKDTPKIVNNPQSQLQVSEKVSASRSADFTSLGASNGAKPSSLRTSANDDVASTTSLILESRPMGLPKKELNEHEKHRQEFEQFIAAAKRKQQKEAQKRSRLRREQLKHEDFMAQALKIWREEILPNWETLRHTKRTRELWWFGLPPSVRSAVWQRCIGNALNITSELYEICKSRAHDRIMQLTNECASGVITSLSMSASKSESQIQTLAAGGDQTVSTGAGGIVVNHFTILNVEPLDAVVSSLNANAVDKESSVEVIRLDVSRTFPQLCIFQKGGPYYELLHSVLGAFVCFRPDVGYVQGMSFISAVLLLNMEPADAFVAFANLLNQPLHLTFYRLDHLGMRAYFQVFELLVKENDSELHSHFQTTGLTADIYLTDWVFTIFGKSLPLDLACRVWDVFMRDNEELLFRTGLGILRLYRDILLNLDFIQGAQFLSRLPENINGDQLFSCIEQCRVSISGKSFAQLVAEVREQLAADQQRQTSATGPR